MGPAEAIGAASPFGRHTAVRGGMALREAMIARRARHSARCPLNGAGPPAEQRARRCLPGYGYSLSTASFTLAVRFF